jgi:hypothetical protein
MPPRALQSSISALGLRATDIIEPPGPNPSELFYTDWGCQLGGGSAVMEMSIRHVENATTKGIQSAFRIQPHRNALYLEADVTMEEAR